MYCKDNDGNKIYLIERIFNTSIAKKKVIFKNNDYLNYSKLNIELKNIILTDFSKYKNPKIMKLLKILMVKK